MCGVHQVDFASILAANESERQHLEQTAQRQEVKNRLQLNKTLQEMEGECHFVTSEYYFVTAELCCTAGDDTGSSSSSSSSSSVS